MININIKMLENDMVVLVVAVFYQLVAYLNNSPGMFISTALQNIWNRSSSYLGKNGRDSLQVSFNFLLLHCRFSPHLVMQLYNGLITRVCIRSHDSSTWNIAFFWYKIEKYQHRFTDSGYATVPFYLKK